MKSFKSVNFASQTQSVVALGCFDGVHIGHAELISTAVQKAHELSLPSVVWSFSEPPKNYFSATRTPTLTTPAEKRALMRALGVDIFVSVPFTKEIASLSAEDFFSQILVGKLHAAHIVCGFNYRFGSGGRGNVDLLRELCKSHGVGLSVIPAIKLGGRTVSSSEIRYALAAGDVQTANAMLGRAYSYRSAVVEGKQLGRTLGFPTVNLEIASEKAIPKYGVYLSRVRIGRRTKYGITNIGVRPTVGGVAPSCETNIFDFEGDLYGKLLSVELLEFIRPERKFASVDELQAQVLADISTAKISVKNYK